VTLAIDIPGRERLELQFLLLDVNGTLSDRGTLLDGVAERLHALRGILEPRLLSADTFATLASIAEQLVLPAQIAASGRGEALRPARARCLPPRRDRQRLQRRRHAGGRGSRHRRGRPEGASAAALTAADIVCRSVLEALELRDEPRALAATFRR